MVESLFAYQGPLVRATRGLKFSGMTALAGPLGCLLSRSSLLHNTRWNAIIPVPLHPWRLCSRGYNQSLLLARWMLRHARSSAKIGKTRLRPGLLRRHRNTAAQHGLPARRRDINVAQAFRVPEKVKNHVRGARLLLVDDVTTTGATLDACMRALHSVGALRVAGLTLLRTLEIEHPIVGPT